MRKPMPKNTNFFILKILRQMYDNWYFRCRRSIVERQNSTTPPDVTLLINDFCKTILTSIYSLYKPCFVFLYVVSH